MTSSASITTSQPDLNVTATTRIMFKGHLRTPAEITELQRLREAALAEFAQFTSITARRPARRAVRR